jgi:hypothetical protein
MPCPYHSPWFDLPNDVWGWVQIMKLPVVQLSLISRFFIPVRSAPCSQTPLSLCSSINMTDRDSHPYKTSGRIMVLYIFNLYVPRQQAGRQKTLNRVVAIRSYEMLVTSYKNTRRHSPEDHNRQNT